MKKPLFLVFASVVILAIPALAQNATTTPVGAMTSSFPATSGAVETTPLSIPLLGMPVYVGVVGSLSSNSSITVIGAGWTAGAYATRAQPYFVRFTSGNQAGRMIKVISNTSDTLTLDTSDNSTQITPLDLAGWAVLPGTDTFEVFPGNTFAILFGDNTAGNPVDFKTSNNIKTADTILLFNGAAWDTYYFDTAYNCWRSKLSPTNVNNNVIYPDTGLIISRRPNNNVPATFTVLGSVPNVAPQSKTTGLVSSRYISTGLPVDMTLGSLNFAGWTKSASYKSGPDVVTIYNGSGWNSYYQSSTAPYKWFDKNNSITDASPTIIPAGSIIGITKRSAVTGSSSFIKTQVMPYSL